MFQLHNLGFSASFKTIPTAGPGYVTSISVTGRNHHRPGESTALSCSAPNATEFTWEFFDDETGALALTRTGADITVNFLDILKKYHCLVTATGTNTLTRHFARKITVLPAKWNVEDADYTIDLDALVGNNTNLSFDSIDTGSYPATDLLNILGADTGSDVRIRNGYRIAIIGGTYNGRINFSGLVGGELPHQHVHIMNFGKCIINATNTSQPYPIQFTTRCQNIIFDGHGDDAEEYGFQLTHHPTTSGQAYFLSGEFMKNHTVCGIDVIGQQGQPDTVNGGLVGGASIQIQGAFSATCNATNWSFGNFTGFDNRGYNLNQEFYYLLYFTDAAQAGFRPYRGARALVYRSSCDRVGRDPYQMSSWDHYELHDCEANDWGRNNESSHCSAVSFNDGVYNGYVYRNKFTNGKQWAAWQTGGTGGNGFFYSNLMVKGTHVGTTGNTFAFAKVENTNKPADLHVFYNTIICNNPALTYQHDNLPEDASLNFTFAGNIIIKGGADQNAPWPELRRINTPSNTNAWVINNRWVQDTNAASLYLDADYKIASKLSPAIGGAFNLESRFPDLPGGYYDRLGYPLLVNRGGAGTDRSYGCHAPFQLYIEPDTVSPVIQSLTVTNPTSSGYDVNYVWDEGGTSWLVTVPVGDPNPTGAQIKLGQRFNGSAALFADSQDAVASSFTVGGLPSPSTTYKNCIVSEDADGNMSLVSSVQGTTAAPQPYEVLLTFIDPTDLFTNPSFGNYWNFVTNMVNTGQAELDLISKTNANTGLKFKLLADLSGGGTDGLSKNTGTNGDITFSGTTYPDKAIEDSAFLTNANPTAWFEIQNANGYTFTLRFLSNRSSGSNLVINLSVNGSALVSRNAVANTTIDSISSISPDVNGKLIFTVDRNTNNGYLNFIHLLATPI